MNLPMPACSEEVAPWAWGQASAKRLSVAHRAKCGTRVATPATATLARTLDPEVSCVRDASERMGGPSHNALQR